MLAQKTGYALITKDAIDRSLEKEHIVNGRAGYEVIFGLTLLNLQNKVSVILDAVFTVDPLRDQTIEIAKRTGADIYFIVCTCSSEKIWKERINNRPPVVEGWTPADWNEVQRVRSIYTEWTHLHLQIDAVDPLEQNFHKVCDYIGIS